MTEIKSSFVTASEVFRIAGIPNDDSVITEANMALNLEEIESFVFEKDLNRRLMYLISVDEDESQGTATGGTTTTLSDSTQTWTSNIFTGYTLWIYEGTGAGQFARISSNTTDTLTFEEIGTAPDDTSQYRIINDIRYNETYDGNGTDTLILNHSDLLKVYSITNGDNSYTDSDIRINYTTCELFAKSFVWNNQYPQQVEITYFAGLDPFTNKKSNFKYIKDYIMVLTAIKTLTEQMGGTYNTPSSYSVPEGTLSIGQAYVNIKSTVDILQKKANSLRERAIFKNPFFL